MDTLLTLENVGLTYHTKKNETVAIKNLSFSVKKEQFVAIIGPSGCGKTTILSMICGLLPVSEGRILMENNLVEVGDKTGYMLQKDELFEWLTIEKNVFLPLKIKGIFTKENKDYCLDLLEKYGLKKFRNYYPRQLSGGMRQRAALIRTLASKPNLLLLDEPFSALDFQTRLAVCDDVYRIIREEKKTALLVTHDTSEAISLADKIIVLSARPATVKSEHVLDFSGCDTPLMRRENKEFSYWFEILWKELKQQ